MKNKQEDEKRPEKQMITGDEGGTVTGSVYIRGGQVTQGFEKTIETTGGAYIGGNVNVGGGDFVGRDKTTISTYTAPNLEQFLTLLSQLQAAIPSAGLDEVTSQIVDSDLRSVESGAKDIQPNGRLLVHRLNGVRILLGDASGSGATVIGLARITEQLIHLAQELFV